MKPLVSFLMPTYGKACLQPDLIAEAVYWFLEQDYPLVELVVLNDAPGQTLVCDAPGVRVANFARRFPTLGDKMNALVELAGGEICCVCEDDDISLPHRASQAVGMLGADFDYWPPRLWWYSMKGTPLRLDRNGWGHNCAAYRRSAFLGGYRSVTRGHDADAHNDALKRCRVNADALTDPKDISYVYRWGVSSIHLSGCADMDAGYANAQAGAPGTYRVEPKMFTDWVEECCQASSASPVR